MVSSFDHFRNLKDAKTLIFDCDGVILNSNSLKNSVFEELTLEWGQEAADRFVSFVSESRGQSRFDLFEHFVRGILPAMGYVHPFNYQSRLIARLISNFSGMVSECLLQCERVEGLHDLRQQFGTQTWLVASAGMADEIRNVFEKKKILDLFDGGIFGAPSPKPDIFRRLKAAGTIKQPSVFLGDSISDYEAAVQSDIGFIFVSGWTDCRGWVEFFQERQIPVIDSVVDLIKMDSK